MISNIALYVEEDYARMSRKAAEMVAQVIREKPEGVFGFATGETPVGLYALLARMHKSGALDASGITTFNLDEYHPIRRDDAQSYHQFMYTHLFDAIGINPARVHIPNGEAADVEAECRAYEAAWEAAGGIDCQILGIGANGHIGFNEPGESFSSGTQYIQLKEMTIRSNARFFESPEKMPRHAITMGIRNIMMSRQIVLLCSGSSKAAILRDALTGPITPLVPASVLQLHPYVAVVADREAAAYL